MAVGEADLVAVAHRRLVGELARLFEAGRDRLFGEDVSPCAHRLARQAGRDPRRGCEDDRVHGRIGEDAVDIGRRAGHGRQGSCLLHPARVDVGDGHERDTRLGEERGQVCAHADVAESDERDGDLRAAHGRTLTGGGAVTGRPGARDW